METTIKSAIEMYIQYISERNISGLNEILDPHFRVTQVVPDTFQTTSMSREQYLQLFIDQKAGGDVYELENLRIEYVGPTASASYVLTGKQTRMHVFLQLVQFSGTGWTILCNTPVVTACPH